MTPERQLNIRIELARQMGWKLAHDGYGLSLDYPTVPQPRALPDPFTNAADKDALVVWLAATEAQWKQFDDHLLTILSLQPLPYDTGFQRMLRRQVLTAPLETITLAAARALGIVEASE